MADRCELVCLDLPRAEELRRSRFARAAAESAALRAHALADPTRLIVAAALAEGGELCVCDLAWITERSQNLVSHHLKSLRAAGHARSRREGKIVFYALTSQGRDLVAAVVGERLEVAG